MTDVLEENAHGMSCGGQQVNNFHSVDDIGIIASTEDCLRELTERINNKASKYRLEINVQKSKTMVIRATPKTITPCKEFPGAGPV